MYYLINNIYKLNIFFYQQRQLSRYKQLLLPTFLCKLLDCTDQVYLLIIHIHFHESDGNSYDTFINCINSTNCLLDLEVKDT